MLRHTSLEFPLAEKTLVAQKWRRCLRWQLDTTEYLETRSRAKSVFSEDAASFTQSPCLDVRYLSFGETTAYIFPGMPHLILPKR